MEEIKFEDIKAGDYIKAIAFEKLDWVVTYLVVERINKEAIVTGCFFDFDNEGNFVKMYKLHGTIRESWKIKYYRLTEKEYINIVGKYMITENL